MDHVDGVAELAAAATSPIQVLIDVDPGLGRTGVHDAEQAAQVARAIATHPNLKLIGVQCYGGQWQHMKGANERAAAIADGMVRLKTILAAIRDTGATFDLVTGGGTGSFAADAAQGVLTEVQPGSFAFMDRDYREALTSDPDGAFEQSLTIATTVITDNHPKWVTVDGGLKAFSTDGPMPEPLTPKVALSKFHFFGDEHGLLMRPDGQPLQRGERITFAPGHIDPTLDRYDLLHLVQGDVLVDIVRIEARGASQ